MDPCSFYYLDRYLSWNVFITTTPSRGLVSDRAARLTPPPTEPRPLSGLGAVPDPAPPGTAAPPAPNATGEQRSPRTRHRCPRHHCPRHRCHRCPRHAGSGTAAPTPGPTAALAAHASMATRRHHPGAAAARLTRVGLGLLQQWGAILSFLGLHLSAATRTAQRAQGQTARRHCCGRERGPARLDLARLCSVLLAFSFPRRGSLPARL